VSSSFNLFPEGAGYRIKGRNSGARDLFLQRIRLEASSKEKKSGRAREKELAWGGVRKVRKGELASPRPVGQFRRTAVRLARKRGKKNREDGEGKKRTKPEGGRKEGMESGIGKGGRLEDIP